MNELETLFGKTRIVPVLAVDDAEKAVPLAEALKSGGMNVLETTLRTDAAIDTIERIVREVDDVVVGAGTVVSEDQLDRSIDAGAQFIVSPGLSIPLVTRATLKSTPILPGVAISTEIMTALGSVLN